MTTFSSTPSLDILEGTLDECRAHAASLGLSMIDPTGAIIGMLGDKAILSSEISAYILVRGERHAGMLQKVQGIWEMVIRK